MSLLVVNSTTFESETDTDLTFGARFATLFPPSPTLQTLAAVFLHEVEQNVTTTVSANTRQAVSVHGVIRYPYVYADRSALAANFQLRDIYHNCIVEQKDLSVHIVVECSTCTPTSVTEPCNLQGLTAGESHYLGTCQIVELPAAWFDDLTEDTANVDAKLLAQYEPRLTHYVVETPLRHHRGC